MAKDFDLKSVLAPVDRIVQRLKDRRADLLAEIELIDTQLQRFEGIKVGTRKPKQDAEKAETPKRRRGKRRRRSREEIDGVAKEIVDFIKGGGKTGVTGKEIKAKFGNLPPSVNAWLKMYSPVKIKTTGAKSQMRYFV